MNGIGVYYYCNTHQFHSLFSHVIQTPFDRTKVLGTTWQWSTVDTWPSPNSTWVAHRFTSTTNFSLWKKVLVKRCTSKTNLRLLINTKLVPSHLNGQPKVDARERLELVGSLIPYIGLRWPYIVCLVWSWTCIFLQVQLHTVTHTLLLHRTKVLSLIKKESCPTKWTNLPVEGWVSIDRSMVAALLSTTPRQVPRSSTDDSVLEHLNWVNSGCNSCQWYHLTTSECFVTK